MTGPGSPACNSSTRQTNHQPTRAAYCPINRAAFSMSAFALQGGILQPRTKMSEMLATQAKQAYRASFPDKPMNRKEKSGPISMLGWHKTTHIRSNATHASAPSTAAAVTLQLIWFWVGSVGDNLSQTYMPNTAENLPNSIGPGNYANKIKKKKRYNISSHHFRPTHPDCAKIEDRVPNLA